MKGSGFPGDRGMRHDRSGELTGLCDAAPERAEGVRGDRAGDRQRQQRERELHRLPGDHHVGRQSISPSLKLLDHLGLIEIEPGPRLVNVFRFSNRWRIIDEVEAERLAELAREVKPHRRFERRREPKLVKPSQPPKPMTVERRRAAAAVPSLPTMPWQDDGR